MIFRKHAPLCDVRPDGGGPWVTTSYTRPKPLSSLIKPSTPSSPPSPSAPSHSSGTPRERLRPKDIREYADFFFDLEGRMPTEDELLGAVVRFGWTL